MTKKIREKEGHAWTSLHGTSSAVRHGKVVSEGWDWVVSQPGRQLSERIPLIREIPYETTSPIANQGGFPGDYQDGQLRKALSINISSGGLLLLMERAPDVDRVVRIHVPTPINNARIPTLAEVRWVRRVPFSGASDLSFVGLKFLL